MNAKELKEQKKRQKQALRQAKKDQANANRGNQNSSSTPPTSGHPNGGSNSSNTDSDNQSRSQQQSPLNLFSGVEQPKAIIAKKQVHTAILHLALQMQNCRIIGSKTRCLAMMKAFRKVVLDYTPPPNTLFSRSLAAHLSQQIDVLKSGRGLSVSMGNAIRWLKQETSELDVELSAEQSKEHLTEMIDVFIRDRIEVADRIIVDTASSHIQQSGDVILTYGRSQVVLDTLVYAFKVQGKKFRVIVADSRPLFEGKKAAEALIHAGVPVSYVLITALPYVMKGVSTLMVGAHAMVSNGNLYSRVGTSMVALMASARRIPVLVLCETIKFSDRIQIDAFSVNELIPKINTSSEPSTNAVFFDLTDQQFISKVITEVGALPASSVPVILREYKQII